MTIKNAILLAAGRGERLRPFTDSTPKPLLCYNQQTLIEQHIVNLQASGIENIIINHAYLGGKIRQYLRDGSRWRINIKYIAEPPGALETGGGLARIFQKYFATLQDPVLVINTDIITNYSIKNFSQDQIAANTLGHLILINKPEHMKNADFGLEDGLIINDPKLYTFAGIAIYHPKMFKNMPISRYSITPTLRNLAQQKLLSGEIFAGLWQDFGVRS